MPLRTSLGFWPGKSGFPSQTAQLWPVREELPSTSHSLSVCVSALCISVVSVSVCLFPSVCCCLSGEALRTAADLGDGNAQVLYANAHLQALSSAAASSTDGERSAGSGSEGEAEERASRESGGLEAEASTPRGGGERLIAEGDISTAFKYFALAAASSHLEAAYSAALLVLQGAVPSVKTLGDRCAAAFQVRLIRLFLLLPFLQQAAVSAPLASARRFSAGRVFSVKVLQRVSFGHSRMHLLHSLAALALRREDSTGALLLSLLASEAGHLSGHVNAAALWAEAAKLHLSRMDFVKKLEPHFANPDALSSRSEQDTKEGPFKDSSAVPSCQSSRVSPLAEAAPQRLYTAGDEEVLETASGFRDGVQCRPEEKRRLSVPFLPSTVSVLARAATEFFAWAFAESAERNPLHEWRVCILPNSFFAPPSSRKNRRSGSSLAEVEKETGDAAAREGRRRVLGTLQATAFHLQVSEFLKCWARAPPLLRSVKEPAAACRFFALHRAALQVRETLPSLAASLPL